MDSAVQAVADRLDDAGYISDVDIATAVYLAEQLERPLLVEGPAGVGKTELAVAWAQATARRLIRLQCYEGIDESRALYEWDYGKQMLFTQILRDKVAALTADTDLAGAIARLQDEGAQFFDRRFLLPRPLLEAITSPQPVVLLVDEIDKADPEFEAFLLELLSAFQVSIPEVGTLSATVRPHVVLTSNRARELSDPLRRRCLHLFIAFPDAAREERIVAEKAPDTDETLRHQVVLAAQHIRGLDLLKAPSIGEVIDWTRALSLLCPTGLVEDAVRTTLGVLLKHQRDVEAVRGRVPEVVRAAHGG